MSSSLKKLLTLLHILSVSPLVLTLGFVAVHFDKPGQAAAFFITFAAITGAFYPLLKRIVFLGVKETLIPEHVVFVDKDPGRMLPMYVLPFVLFANAKTEDLGLIVFIAILIGYILNGPLSLQTHPIFWIFKWRIYSVTTFPRKNEDGTVGSKISVFVLTNKKIGLAAHPLRVVRLSPAFFIDTGIFAGSCSEDAGDSAAE